MKKTKKKRTGTGSFLLSLLSICLFAAVAAWMCFGVKEAGDSSDQEALRLAQDSVRKAAISCYALEGMYPATYEDLKSYSGISIDEDKYIIFYEAFASNIMPDITALEKEVAQ